VHHTCRRLGKGRARVGQMHLPPNFGENIFQANIV